MSDYAGLNLRVGALEKDMGDVQRNVHDFRDVLYGDKERQTVGLVQQGHDVAALLRQWATLVKVLKWATGTFGVAAISLAANVLFGGA